VPSLTHTIVPAEPKELKWEVWLWNIVSEQPPGAVIPHIASN